MLCGGLSVCRLGYARDNNCNNSKHPLGQHNRTENPTRSKEYIWKGETSNFICLISGYQKFC